MDIYKLYGSWTALSSAIAALDIRRDAFIVGIHAYLYATAADALNDGGNLEVSFASTYGFTSNDTTASIFGLGVAQGFLTTGGGPIAQSMAISGLAIPARAGERIYLHGGLTGSAGPTMVANVWLYAMEAGGPGRADVRLR